MRTMTETSWIEQSEAEQSGVEKGLMAFGVAWTGAGECEEIVGWPSGQWHFYID